MKFLWAAVMAMFASLVSLAALAEALSVLDLRLHPDPAWQRGTPQQEQEDDALLLSWPVPDGVALQVLVPRTPPLIKSDAETFYRNLARKWSAQYGKAAAVGWIEFGKEGGKEGQKGMEGLRWLSCRRPARSGDGVVFHLATVHEGRAYSLLLFAPPRTETLPQAVHALVAGAGFQGEATVWRHAHSQFFLPQAEALEAIVQLEVDALGDKGMLTGYGVKQFRADKPSEGGGAVESMQLNWFLDGFRWDSSAGRDERLPFEVNGQLAADVAPELPGGALQLGLQTGASDTLLKAQATLHAYCGPLGPWNEAWADLARGARGPLGRLARDHGCPDFAGHGVLATLEARPGQTVARSVALALPPASAQRLWVEVRLLPEAGSLGEGLLDRLGLYLAYEPRR